MRRTSSRRTASTLALMICHAVQTGERRQRRQDDLGARGLAVPRPEGRRADPQVGPRADPADVHRPAREEKNGHYDVKWLKTVSPGNVQPPVKPFRVGLRDEPSDSRDSQPRARHRRRERSSPMSRSRLPRASCSASSARTGRGRRRSSTCSRACTGRPPGGSSCAAATSPASRRSGARARGWGARSRCRASSRS